MRYVIANPSSYAYFDERRPVAFSHAGCCSSGATAASTNITRTMTAPAIAEREGLKPMARLKSWSLAGVGPEVCLKALADPEILALAFNDKAAAENPAVAQKIGTKVLNELLAAGDRR